MPSVDLVFPVLGTRLPTDHAYPLYAALARQLAWLHRTQAKVAICPITGLYLGNGLLRVNRDISCLRIRVPNDNIRDVLPLAGKPIRVMGERLQLGVAHVEPLRPDTSLIAHAMTIKGFEEEESFLEAARRQLDALQVQAEAEVPRFCWGERQGQPLRRVLRIKDTCVVCFPLRLRGLSPEDSLKVQGVGLGGRRRMGAGVFLPMPEGKA